MDKSIDRKRLMGEEHIPRLLARLSVPAMVGMIVNALYNLVDTIFVGQGVGPLAIAGLSIAFPLQMLLAGFAQMYGVGAASIVSRRLGEKREEDAAAAAGGALSVTVLTAVVMTSLGLLLLEPILTLFGATEDILPYAKDYSSIILFGSTFLSISMCSNNIIRAEGQAKISMIIMLIGTGLNLILDPIFIFALSLGIRGAAMATVISQVASALFALQFFLRGKSSLQLSFRSLKIRFPMFVETVVLGLPTFVRQTGTSFMTLTVNNMLGLYGGDMAIAAYGMISKLMIFFLMPVFGIVQGFQPIAGFNYGARLFKRVRQVLVSAITVTTIMGTFAMLLILLFPRLLLGMFTTDSALIDLASPALRIVLIALPLVGIQAIGAALFQSIGKSVPALLLGLSRQFFILIPLVLILPRFFALSGVWLAFPLADVASTVITGIWLFFEIRNLNRIHFETLNPVEEFPRQVRSR